jgi:DNA/RNA endonuclease G (NUC1)
MVRVQVPQQYWKLILAEEAGQLRAFAFLLRQDLSHCRPNSRLTRYGGST